MRGANSPAEGCGYIEFLPQHHTMHIVVHCVAMPSCRALLKSALRLRLHGLPKNAAHNLYMKYLESNRDPSPINHPYEYGYIYMYEDIYFQEK